MPEDSDIYTELDRASDRWLTKYPDLPISSGAMLLAPIVASLTNLDSKRGYLPAEPIGKQEVIENVKRTAVSLYWIGFDRCMNGAIAPITSIQDLDRDVLGILDDEAVEAFSEFLKPIQEYAITSIVLSWDGSEVERDRAVKEIVDQTLSFGYSSLLWGLTEATAKQTAVPPELLTTYAAESVFEVQRILAKWKSLDAPLAKKTMHRVTEDLTVSMATMKKACQAKKQTDFGPELSERIHRFPSMLSEVANMALWVGFDQCMTGKVPPLEKKEQFERPITEGISDSTREIFMHISLPIEDTLSAMLQFCVGKGVTSANRSEELGNQLTVSVIEMMTNSFFFGLLEASVKMKDIPIIGDD